MARVQVRVLKFLNFPRIIITYDVNSAQWPEPLPAGFRRFGLIWVISRVKKR
jgi:hypothetical protein